MRSIALHRGEVVRIRDERWTVATVTHHAGVALLSVRGCERSNRGTVATYVMPFEPIERLPSVRSTRVVSRRRWRHVAREVLAAAIPMPDALVAAAAAKISILPYQLEPALAAVSGAAARILIADDVGLGKTIEAGLIVAETIARRADARAIVVCPAGLREQWQGELESRFGLAPVILDASAVRRFAATDAANPWTLCPLIIASIDYIKRPEVLKALEPLLWDLVVVDEAHGVAGESDRHVATTLLAERARVTVMLTGTPHSGDERAFARLVASGDLDASFPLLVFRRTRSDINVSAQRRTRWLRVRPTTPEAQTHSALMAYVRQVWRQPASREARLAMILLTRRANSSVTSLARSVERRLAWLSGNIVDAGQLTLPLSDTTSDEEPGAEIGAPGLLNGDAERAALQTILAHARRAMPFQSKLEALARLLNRAREPAIVFTEYRDTLAVLEARLSKFGTCHLHGGLTRAERVATLRLFTAGERRVLLATDAASEGLNLQERCRLVVHLEVPWTPTRIEQRVGRVDRFGQARTVHQIHLVTRGSTEEERTADLARRASRASGALHSLTMKPPDDEAAAAWVIGGEPLPDVDEEPRREGLFTVDLKVRSVREAERLLTARQLTTFMPGTHASSTFARPVVAIRSGACRTVSAFWLEFLDAENQFLWESLVGIDDSALQVRSRRAAEVRMAIDRRWSELHHLVTEVQRHLVGRLEAVLRDNVRIAVQRELAIARHAARRHARMASGLVQRGLFDRRGEREAAVQRELLQQALAASRTRLDELNRRQKLSAGGVRPAFSLVA